MGNIYYDMLNPGQSIVQGDILISADHRFQLFYQDGSWRCTAFLTTGKWFYWYWTELAGAYSITVEHDAPAVTGRDSQNNVVGRWSNPVIPITERMNISGLELSNAGNMVLYANGGSYPIWAISDYNFNNGNEAGERGADYYALQNHLATAVEPDVTILEVVPSTGTILIDTTGIGDTDAFNYLDQQVGIRDGTNYTVIPAMQSVPLASAATVGTVALQMNIYAFPDAPTVPPTGLSGDAQGELKATIVNGRGKIWFGHNPNGSGLGLFDHPPNHERPVAHRHHEHHLKDDRKKD